VLAAVGSQAPPIQIHKPVCKRHNCLLAYGVQRESCMVVGGSVSINAAEVLQYSMAIKSHVYIKVY
jgi:hypothetical protein